MNRNTRAGSNDGGAALGGQRWSVAALERCSAATAWAKNPNDK